MTVRLGVAWKLSSLLWHDGLAGESIRSVFPYCTGKAVSMSHSVAQTPLISLIFFTIRQGLSEALQGTQQTGEGRGGERREV